MTSWLERFNRRLLINQLGHNPKAPNCYWATAGKTKAGQSCPVCEKESEGQEDEH